MLYSLWVRSEVYFNISVLLLAIFAVFGAKLIKINSSDYLINDDIIQGLHPSEHLYIPDMNLAELLDYIRNYDQYNNYTGSIGNFVVSKFAQNFFEKKELKPYI